MKKKLFFLAISGVMLSAPVAMAQSYDKALPKTTPVSVTVPVTRAIPLRSDTDVTVAMRTDMAALDGLMAKMRAQMTTINATADVELRQKLMQEQMLRMQDHMNAMQKAMGHMADLQSTQPPPDPPHAMPSH